MDPSEPESAASLQGVADPPLPFEAGRFADPGAELASVRRLVLVFYLLAPVACAAAILAGFAVGRPAVIAAGAAGLGVLAVVVGVLAVVKRRLFFVVRSLRLDRTRYVLYEGLAAVPFGLAWIVAGLTLAAGAAGFLVAGGALALRASLLERPGLALVPAGAFLLTQGLGFTIGFARRGGSRGERIGRWLLELPARLGGLVLVLLGTALLAAGLHEWAMPAAFDAAIAELARGRLPFGW